MVTANFKLVTGHFTVSSVHLKMVTVNFTVGIVHLNVLRSTLKWSVVDLHYFLSKSLHVPLSIDYSKC